MDWTTQRLQQFECRLMAVDDAGAFTYGDFLRKVERWRPALDRWGVVGGDRVGLVADHHIDVIALIHALMMRGCIVVPLSVDDRSAFDTRLATACVNKLVSIDTRHTADPRVTPCRDLRVDDSALHPLLRTMASREAPGFVIFTSGSTGREKAVLFDYGRLTRAYREQTNKRPREPLRTLLFYKFDHIGGLDTLFYVMFNGGTLVTCRSRAAKDVCGGIERHAVQLLPATPSFLTMMLMSGVHRHHDLSSLEVISYGTEAMPASTLAGLHQAFPAVALRQTYGLSELGVLPTKSRDSSSKWMKIGGAGLDLKVRDGRLWVRSERAMLGYLNAPSPFDEEGWYDTGDRVEVDGDYFQILGREAELINVAGEKVFPVEIESFLLTLPNVRDVIVRAKKSPVVGQMVWAEFVLNEPEDPAAFRRRVVERCLAHLAPFKVPGLITLAGKDSLVGSRFKKIRKAAGAIAAAAPENAKDSTATAAGAVA